MENKDELILNDYQLEQLFINSPRFIPVTDCDNNKTIGELLRSVADIHDFEIGKCYILKSSVKFLYDYTYTIFRATRIVGGDLLGEYVTFALNNISYQKECVIFFDYPIIRNRICAKEISVDVFNNIKEKVTAYNSLHNKAINSISPFHIQGNTIDYTRLYYRINLDYKLGIPYNDNFLRVKISDFKKAVERYNSLSMDKLNKALSDLKKELITNHRYLMVSKGNGSVRILCFDDFYINSYNDTQYGVTTNTIRCKYHFIDSNKFKGIFSFSNMDLVNNCKSINAPFDEVLREKKYTIENNVGDRLFGNYNSLCNEITEILHNIMK